MVKGKNKNRNRPNKAPKMSKTADKYAMYLKSVQAPDVDAAFFSKVFKRSIGRTARTLREDFCGTFSVCCEWVKRDKENEAWGVDLEPECLGDQARARVKQAGAGIDDRAQDVLLEGLDAQCLGHQDGGALRQLDLRRPTLEQRDAIRHPVRDEDLARHRGDVAGLDGVDTPRAEAGSGDRQHTTPGADVEDHVAAAKDGE